MPGLQFASQPSQPPKINQAPVSASQPPPSTVKTPRSLEEFKKEAQKAVLRLWPMGVKYPQYIDEGFDEKVIRGLFGDLHLDMPASVPPVAQTDITTAQSQHAIPQATIKAQQGSDAQKQGASQVKEQTAAAESSKSGEERKDRIARLLAAKAAKAPAPVPTAPKAKPIPTQPKPIISLDLPKDIPTGPAAMKKAKVMGDKDRLLKQKMAALQKSREAQTQKSAAGKPSADSSRSADSATEVPAVQPFHRSLPGISGPAGPSAPESQDTASQAASSIPGLLLSSIVPKPPSVQRKRPVASDFVEYSSTDTHSKRPFGQARKETSFVIDISDGSDDEEMDMDMGSPAEDLSTQAANAYPNRSIRDFPPLSDALRQRQFSSPSNTPPTGLALNGRRRENELEFKEREIQEMRRKIAEAEARRKAKKSPPGPPAPSAAQTVELKTGDTPSMAETVLAKPQNLAKLNPKEKADRRGRIVSLVLPQIDEDLEKTASRLKEIQEEQLRLQAQMDARMAQKKILTEELEQLDESPSDAASHPDGTNSEAAPGTSSQTE